MCGPRQRKYEYIGKKQIIKAVKYFYLGIKIEDRKDENNEKSINNCRIRL